jgi:hypothetical protein
MLEITEIIERSVQGATKPFICKASDNKTYYIKGRNATASGLIKEWFGAQLAQAFTLPLPSSQILYADSEFIEAHDKDVIYELGDGYVFGSEEITSVTELKNEDRTLTENGGNPNLLWKSEQSQLYLIDHNLIFEKYFDQNGFWKTHVFSHINFEKFDDRLDYQNRMMKALDCWQSTWDEIPEQWKELNDDTGLFDPDETLQRLTSDADGKIWRKLL